MDVEINFKGTIMKTLEHEIRDVMSRKKEKDLIEEVNNNFINLVNTLYEEELTEEQFVTLYEAYINYLIEQESWYSKAYSKAMNHPIAKAILPAYGAYDVATRAGQGDVGGLSSMGAGALVAGAKLAGKAGSKLIPGIGSAIAAGETYDNIKKGKYVDAAISGLGVIPGPTQAISLGLSVAKGAHDAFAPDPSAKPPNTDNKSPAATPPPVSPPGANSSSTSTGPRRGTLAPLVPRDTTGSTGAVQNPTQQTSSSTTPTPATTNVSRQPEMTTPLAGGAKDSRMSVEPPKTTQPDTKPATTAQPSTSTKSQEPPESARKQKPSTSSDSSYSGRSIGDYGKDNSWVQPAFNRG